MKLPGYKKVLLAVVIVGSGIIVSSQYYFQEAKHKRLAAIGKWAPIEATHYSSWGVDYARYYFITEKGDTIKRDEKCGKQFSLYEASTAIYNPENPEEFELIFDFVRYNATWRIIFFFFLYFPVMVLVTYNGINLALKVYAALKAKER